MESISDTVNNLTPGDATSVDLSGFAEAPTGTWPKGWYAAEIIEGYQAGGHTFLTECTPSKKGDSFNFRVCLRMTGPGGAERTNFRSFNYRPGDFSPDRLQTVTNLRAEFAGAKGKWPGFEDEQRSSLALGQLGQLQQATGAAITLTPEGAIEVAPFLGKKPYVRLTVNEETGYNEINAFSPFKDGIRPRKGK